MKTRLLIFAGIVITTVVTLGFLFSSQSDDSKPFVKAEYVKITGVINNWQPIDGPAFSLITNEPVDAKVSNAGIFLYGDVLKPHMKDKTVIITGTLVPNYVEYRESLELRTYGGDPSTAAIIVDEVQIKSFDDSAKVKIQQLSKNEILSKGTGFDLPKDTFTQEDLEQLQQREKELNKIADDPDTLDEKRRQIHLEIQEMQVRLQYPFQTGVPYHLVTMLQEKYAIFKEHRSELKGEYWVTVSGPNNISHVHHALRIGIHPDHFTLSELEYQDEKIREYLGSEMNILYYPEGYAVPLLGSTTSYDPIAKCEEQNGWRETSTCHLPDDSESDYELDESEFLQIKNNMENIGYHICDIQLEENKILMVLNWIYEDSEPEKTILSQIPSDVSYEIKYLGGYANYFISKESVFSCEGLENEK